MPQASRVIITSSKVEHGWQSRGYNLPKALCIREKTHKVIEYEGRRRIKSHKGSGGPQETWCEHRYSTSRRKKARRSDYQNNRLIQSSNAKELWAPNQGIRSKHSDQGWIGWVGLRVQSMAISLVEIQLMFNMTSEPEGWILGSDWGLRAFATYWIKGLEMIMTKDTNEYC